MECSRLEISSGPPELQCHKIIEDIIEFIIFSGFKRENLAGIILDFSDSIDAAYRSNDDDILSGKQTLSRSMPQPINLFIYGCLFFDISVCLGNICFWLIIIIIGNKIMNCIFGEKFFEFLSKLGSESLIMGHDQSGPSWFGDDIRHRKSLSWAGHS
ncbi:MAG: hypothetical protein ACD_2C00257G0002 [uncultured bacterium (gcode 4)]|uniref:Uncharacterized protein n=1 Tax=uncultured bacterium (gcode 4) TaxID=1234023 RepID=K2G171_9BACT|nr:MAG: hypothetical protein ACD_2C00257G0002 [uncultured bacterium (gcode 4)]